MPQTRMKLFVKSNKASALPRKPWSKQCPFEGPFSDGKEPSLGAAALSEGGCHLEESTQVVEPVAWGGGPPALQPVLS